LINRCEPDLESREGRQRYGKLLGMRLRETAAMLSLATKMRLTQQAQMHLRTAGRAMSNEHGGPKPWDIRP
jgi:hypothetical protein